MSEILSVKALSKFFGKKQVLSDINFSLKQGEIVSILGASGCGKSTFLRIIAGLEAKSGGQISVGCSLAMMFQNYALFPHLSVAQNVEFALHKLPKSQRKQKVSELLAKFGLSELANKGCEQISGGQAQRVAFARAVANEEKLLLLDEPFSNLDAGLKSKMRDELKNLIHQNGLSAIMVTHDKEDAFLLSDRIALMQDGRILACDEPRKLYFEPANIDVAAFLGQINSATLQDLDALEPDFAKWLKKRNLIFRPEDIVVGEKFEAKVLERSFLGASASLLLEHNGFKFSALVDSKLAFGESFKFDLRGI